MSQMMKDMDLLDAHVGIVQLRNLRKVDWLLVLLFLFLAALGLRTLTSASTDAPHHLKQAVWLGLGCGLALCLVCIDYRFLVSMAPVMFTGAVALLLAVEFLGHEAMGGRHWLALGPFRLQPSELSKIALVYALAWYASHVRGRIRRPFYLLLGFSIAGFICLLILKQGDLGTMLVLLPVPFVMLYVAGARWWHLLIIILAGLAAAPVAWLKLKPHQRERLEVFWNPDKATRDQRFQLLQAQIAVGSGRMSGKGFGQGTQAHLKYIPEYHNDFIFALFAEEAGFIGAAIVVGLFAAFQLRALQLARDCPDMSATLLIVGSASIVGAHAFVNIAITLGLMPVTGLPLPFFSYGGSFYLTTMLCIGTILSANVRRGMFE
ncbi:MAG: rod shape-determining protein RodA [bacterium]|nr:rod shape-determining protein RodA [bacterium]